MKVALVYDRVNKWGGAERVLLALHTIFPDAPLFTSVYDARKAPWAKVFPAVYTSFLNKIVPLRRRHEVLAPLMPLAFESFTFASYDVVISVTSEAAKGIVTSPNTLHICYCLTPTRYLWSGYDSYFRDSVFKSIAGPVVNYLRKWDKMAAQRPDVLVAISTEIRKRIKKYYHRDSTIIFPPLSFNSLATTLHSVAAKKESGMMKEDNGREKHRNYFLVVSRLVPYKRVDLAIAAFNKLGLPLYIVGTGSEEKKLKAMARKNIVFLGQLTDSELSHYYENARALIMPQEEDFGLVALEAQSFGVPVIAFKAGGVRDTVVDGTTGVFFRSQTPRDLKQAVKRFESLEFDRSKAVQNAKRFSEARFEKEIKDLIANCLR